MIERIVEPTALAGLVALLSWVWLLLFRGGFWRAEGLPVAALRAAATWPSITAVVPARNEADVIARSIGSLLTQDYPGHFHVILVDDHSTDGTADVARQAADTLGRSERLTVVAAAGRPPGWVGKVNAMQ